MIHTFYLAAMFDHEMWKNYLTTELKTKKSHIAHFHANLYCS